MPRRSFEWAMQVSWRGDRRVAFHPGTDVLLRKVLYGLLYSILHFPGGEAAEPRGKLLLRSPPPGPQKMGGGAGNFPRGGGAENVLLRPQKCYFSSPHFTWATGRHIIHTSMNTTQNIGRTSDRLSGYRQGLAAPRSNSIAIAAVRPRVTRGRAPPAESLLVDRLDDLCAAAAAFEVEL